MISYDLRKTFKEALLEQSITDYIGKKELDEILSPVSFIGSSEAICDEILREALKNGKQQ